MLFVFQFIMTRSKINTTYMFTRFGINNDVYHRFCLSENSKHFVFVFVKILQNLNFKDSIDKKGRQKPLVSYMIKLIPHTMLIETTSYIYFFSFF